jgi:hypothetical protein
METMNVLENVFVELDKSSRVVIKKTLENESTNGIKEKRGNFCELPLLWINAAFGRNLSIPVLFGNRNIKLPEVRNFILTKEKT